MVFDADAAAPHLSRIGIDNVQGALEGGFGSWRKSGEPLERSGNYLARRSQGRIDFRRPSRHQRVTLLLQRRQRGHCGQAHLHRPRHLVGQAPVMTHRLPAQKHLHTVRVQFTE